MHLQNFGVLNFTAQYVILHIIWCKTNHAFCDVKYFAAELSKFSNIMLSKY